MNFARSYRDNVPRRTLEASPPLALASSLSVARRAFRTCFSVSPYGILERPDIPDKEFSDTGAAKQWRIEV